MTFNEIVELVQTGEQPPKVFSDFRAAAYRHLKLIRETSERLSAELAVDALSPEEYRHFRGELDKDFRWLREWFSREEQREQIHSAERRKLLALGQLYKQALEENNTLALRMVDLWDGIKEKTNEID